MSDDRLENLDAAGAVLDSIIDAMVGAVNANQHNMVVEALETMPIEAARPLVAMLLSEVAAFRNKHGKPKHETPSETARRTGLPVRDTDGKFPFKNNKWKP